MTNQSHGLKILIIDPIPTMRRVVKSLFRQSGYTNFVEADDQEGACKVLEREGDVDLIVSDSPVTGASKGLFSALSEHPKFGKIPFLMVANGQERAAMDVLMSDKLFNVIVKPFTGKALSAKVDSMFVKRKRKFKKAG